MRKTKIDELPGLFDVLFGHMSLVGPRPEVPKYVEAFRNDYRDILLVRPGLSDFASVKYRDEEEILARQPDPETFYRQVILPDKIQLAKEYVREMSLATDLRIVAETVRALVGNDE
jgi:lipopolysaccharide/colanic/teichoic acid biosynthesis glycosyltransferase